MEFSFSEDQNELRRAARRFLEAESSEAHVRAAMETEQGYDSAVWEQLSEELAWTALTIPEAYGGLGMSYLDLHPLMEEMGRALLCSPFFSTICLGANALMLGGSEAQKEAYLPAIAAGEATATLAYAEDNRQLGADGSDATAGTPVAQTHCDLNEIQVGLNRTRWRHALAATTSLSDGHGGRLPATPMEEVNP